MGATDIEWLAFEAGLKPGLRLTLGAAWLADAERRVARAGFASVRAARAVELAGREAEEILYVGRGPEDAAHLREAERAILPGGPPRARPGPEELGAHRALGRGLGY